MKKKMPRWIITSLLIFSMVVLGSSFVSAVEQSPVLTLEQAINIAMENSLQRQLAEGDFAIAKDKLAQAKSGYLPRLTLNAGYNHYNELPTDVELGENLVKLNNVYKLYWRRTNNSWVAL